MSIIKIEIHGNSVELSVKCDSKKSFSCTHRLPYDNDEKITFAKKFGKIADMIENYTPRGDQEDEEDIFNEESSFRYLRLENLAGTNLFAFSEIYFMVEDDNSLGYLRFETRIVIDEKFVEYRFFYNIDNENRSILVADLRFIEQKIVSFVSDSNSEEIISNLEGRNLYLEERILNLEERNRYLENRLFNA